MSSCLVCQMCDAGGMHKEPADAWLSGFSTALLSVCAGDDARGLFETFKATSCAEHAQKIQWVADVWIEKDMNTRTRRELPKGTA